MLLLVVGITVLRTVRGLIWDDGIVPYGWFRVIVSYGTVIWALPAASAVCAVLGFLSYRGLPASSRGGRLADPHPTPCPFPVVFRIVSRGRNTGALRATVASVRAEMRDLPLFAYSIEVVTDEPVELEPGPDLRALVVPTDYVTAQGSLYKARALQYAVEQARLSPDTWLFHLDEESQISPSLVIGIRDAVAEEEANGRHRIGQGAILYHRHLHKHPLLTLADMVRTGDDLGRFHFQHRLGLTVFGLHGSFILVRNSVESRCDFDFGPEGSITEDAFWAVRQMALGSRCRWVDGYLLEQSTQSVGDFVRQRRRWFTGLVRVVLFADTTFWVRLSLSVFVSVWALSWIGMAYTLLNLFLGLRTQPVLAAMADLALVTAATNYLVGLTVNLRERPRLPLLTRIALYAAQLCLIPVFAVLEAAGVVLGVLRPERGFHVVTKSAQDTPAVVSAG